MVPLRCSVGADHLTIRDDRFLMEFQILSHACLRVSHNGSTLVVDPWLHGSAYWRSWWNYPPVPEKLAASLSPDFIYLTHIHWDHFHGISLRKLGRDVPVYVPEDRYSRLKDDLKAVGMRDIREIPHGRTVTLARDFAITPYLFFPMTDSALVIEAGSRKILNANDCKILGLPLRQIKRRFGTFDFALRSHSSANTRVCQAYLGEGAADLSSFDNKGDYLRSFSNFMKAVSPTYAIPFASNHCHLHRDTFDFNRWQQTPQDVRTYFDTFARREGLSTKLVTMLPGSRWSEEGGFELVDEQEWFSDRAARIDRYREENAGKLDAYYDSEARAKVSDADVEKFFRRFFRHVPWLYRRRFKGRPVFLRCSTGTDGGIWRIDVHERIVERVDLERYRASTMRIEMPAVVLRQALRMNMFAHAGISKRVRYIATRELMPVLNSFLQLLNFEEYELIPLRNNLSPRSIRVWLRRWREVVAYAQLIWIMRVRRISQKEVEQVALLEYS